MLAFHVPVQKALSAETFAAYSASEVDYPQMRRVQVLGQLELAAEDFAAVGAIDGVDVVPDIAVHGRIQVAGQAMLADELLIANFARVVLDFFVHALHVKVQVGLATELLAAVLAHEVAHVFVHTHLVPSQTVPLEKSHAALGADPVSLPAVHGVEVSGEVLLYAESFAALLALVIFDPLVEASDVNVQAALDGVNLAADFAPVALLLFDPALTFEASFEYERSTIDFAPDAGFHRGRYSVRICLGFHRGRYGVRICLGFHLHVHSFESNFALLFYRLANV